MSAVSDRTNSLAWQTRQLFQRLREWGEYQFSQVDIDWPETPRWPWLEPLAQGLFWLGAGMLALGTGWLLYQGVMTYLNRSQQRPLTGTPSPRQEVLKQAAYWWREAQRLGQQGDYAGACTALYMAGLLRLSETKTVPYQVSRTDGEYLDSLNLQTAPRPYELLIRTHERLTFGEEQATEEMYQRCRRAYQEIATP